MDNSCYDFMGIIVKLVEQKKVEYYDISYSSVMDETIVVLNGIIEEIKTGSHKSISLRVLKDGAFGFSSHALTSDKVTNQLVKEACDQAQAVASINKEKITLTEERTYEDAVFPIIKTDPFTIPNSTKIDLLVDASQSSLAISDRIKLSRVSYCALKEKSILWTSEGTKIEQENVRCGVGVMNAASEAGQTQQRLLPNVHGNFSTLGFEYIETLDLVETAEKSAREALLLLQGRKCPDTASDLVLAPDQLSLQILLTCANSFELDRVLGVEEGYASSFLRPQMLGNQLGNENFTLIADASILGGLGSFFYDREGVPAQRTVLVNKGVVKAFLCSRDTAPKIDQHYSNGAARAEDFSKFPLVRGTNCLLDVGNWKSSEIIEDTRDGYLFEGASEWVIDAVGDQFRFGSQIGYRIKNGERMEVIKRPVYLGKTTRFFKTMDAVSDKHGFEMYGYWSFPKGLPAQKIPVGAGCPVVRFKNTKIGN
ncbi:MAG: TldD/PmbA family protein [Candidatus Odinarchaeota archaeon]